MRRAGFVLLFVGAAFAAFAASGAQPVLAYGPVAPLYDPVNNTPLTSLLNVPDTIPAAPTPTVPGVTYPAAWNDGAASMTKARMAARALPGLRLLGTIGLATTAFEAGWH